mmetsp:Transcript_12027/g.17410  ORF Transcript_12027/g.17410 Transcript_12027/m.17410 type:complete len:365 (+) Transcript_12027:86-1180(+)|eukprot:CAMPEP_0195519440 /NCGR_PEP_ID=MMETSP0794_2-20130614/14796_1 /TAXON_ID=515487 /ORGANISM="Stephanopyxis turris, Strain CCMP 815" /LENGTH=364 /DNA_ID=CAMNT_0040648595 /DNA_START=78 /DNA_END=1172 /DNA_ORIENTATION=+
MPQPNLNSDDYYAILGCSKSASDSELKKAYRKLAVKWHPDKNPGNETATKNFQKISEAFSILSDKEKRKTYDMFGKAGADRADQMPTGGAGFGGFPQGGHASMQHMNPEEAQAFFGQFFGGSVDPFADMGGGGGFPGSFSHFSSSSNGSVPFNTSRQTFGGGMDGDPISMMFQQQMGGIGGQGGMGSMGGSQTFPAQPAKRFDSIPPGTIVSLKGLVNAPDRNGDRGIVKKYTPETSRYVIQIEDSNETMSVKPSNLLQHVHVRIHDIGSQPELNGKTGTILAWNPTKERYNIYVMALTRTVSLQPGNVVLDAGTVAQLTGLSSRPELNGKWGTITEWIRESNKYDVQLSPLQIIRVKVENMRV